MWGIKLSALMRARREGDSSLADGEEDDGKDGLSVDIFEDGVKSEGGNEYGMSSIYIFEQLMDNQIAYTREVGFEKLN